MVLWFIMGALKKTAHQNIILTDYPYEGLSKQSHGMVTPINQTYGFRWWSEIKDPDVSRYSVEMPRQSR